MLRFITELAVFFALMAASVFPLQRVARHVRRRIRPRRWMTTAAVIASIAAALGWSSRDLQRSCRQEVNEGCIDIGGQGLQLLLVGGFMVVALSSAYLMYND